MNLILIYQAPDRNYKNTLHPSPLRRKSLYIKRLQRWRVVITLHLSQPQCLSGFQAKRWRVKGKIESSFFLTQKQLRKHLPNRNNSPLEIYITTHYFLPGYGTILPQLRATLCHSQAKSGISLLSHLNRAHSLMPHALQTERKNWF